MASFYNNYYRYYRPPYLPTNYKNPVGNNNNHNIEDKSPCANNTDESSSKKNNTRTFEENFYENFSNEKKSSRSYSFGPINFRYPLFNDIEEPIFEILGIELYLDDIIILGLLFFLYKEGVQDELLYISLILLLIS